MDRSIARLNIQRFRKLLAEEIDEAKRLTLQQLLAEEEAKLQTAEGKSPEQRST
jgi:hypothetical protein